MRVPRPVATWLGLVLTASLVVAVQPGSAGAAEQWPQRKPAPPYLVQTEPVPVKALPPDNVLSASGGGSPAASWPSAGAAEVQVGSASQATQAGGLPVWVGPPASVAAAGAPVPPAAVRVEVLDHAASVRQGVAGLVLRLRRSDRQATAT